MDRRKELLKRLASIVQGLEQAQVKLEQAQLRHGHNVGGQDVAEVGQVVRRVLRVFDRETWLVNEIHQEVA